MVALRAAMMLTTVVTGRLFGIGQVAVPTRVVSGLGNCVRESMHSPSRYTIAIPRARHHLRHHLPAATNKR